MHAIKKLLKFLLIPAGGTSAWQSSSYFLFGIPIDRISRRKRSFVRKIGSGSVQSRLNNFIRFLIAFDLVPFDNKTRLIDIVALIFDLNFFCSYYKYLWFGPLKWININSLFIVAYLGIYDTLIKILIQSQIFSFCYLLCVRPFQI